MFENEKRLLAAIFGCNKNELIEKLKLDDEGELNNYISKFNSSSRKNTQNRNNTYERGLLRLNRLLNDYIY